MLTAHGADETRVAMLGAGATPFLEKPVRTPALLDPYAGLRVDVIGRVEPMP